MTALAHPFVGNAFNILGLSSSATLKEIRTRARQLVQFAKVEEVPAYATDIGEVTALRTDDDIRRAVESVSGIQERLKQIFFWFEDHNVESRNAVALISRGLFPEAIASLESSERHGDWLGRKNLALAFLLDAYKSSSFASFSSSLDLWKLIAESDEFWDFYSKNYLLHDELGTSSCLFEEFRSTLSEYVSDEAIAFYRLTHNPKAIGACYSAFGRIAQSIDSEILQPIIMEMKHALNELEGLSDSDATNTAIEDTLHKVQKCFDRLDAFDLTGYSPLTILKDDTAERLRSVAVDCYNRDEDLSTSQMLLDYSSSLAVSQAVIDRIENDKQQLAENEAWRSAAIRLDSIKASISEGQFAEAKNAYFQLDNELAQEDTSSSTPNRVHLLLNYCLSFIEKGHELSGKRRLGIHTLAVSAILTDGVKNLV